MLDATKNAVFCARWLDRCEAFFLTAAVFLIPLWFLPSTIDALELNKQTLFILLTMAALLTWLGRTLLLRRFQFFWSWTHMAILLFGVGFFVASILSEDRYLSFVGNFGQMQWSFTTLFTFILFSFLLAQRVKTTAAISNFLLWLLSACVIAGGIGLLSMTGHLPLSWLSHITANTFTTIGTMNAFAVFMTIPIVLGMSLIVFGCADVMNVSRQKDPRKNFFVRTLVFLSIAVGIAVIVVVDFWVTWVTLLFGAFCTVAILFVRTRKFFQPVRLILPGILCLLSFALLLWPTPIKLNIPADVVPSVSHSWQITKQV
ncbi:MAG: hypothetical protein AAB664_02495, partial [Patescibacteria group bacterium]